MVAKKKKIPSPTHVVEASEEEEISEKEGERRPPITQVVEVVEETEEQPLEKSAAEEVQSPKMEEHKKSTEPLSKEGSSEEVTDEDVSILNQEEPEPIKRKEMVEELFQSRRSPVMPELSGHAKRSKKPIILWAIIVIVVALVVGGGLWAFTTKSVSLPSITMEPTPTPTETPAPSPTPEPPARDEVTIEVLNGGGVSGAASKMKAFLEEKGYTVAKTGNADEYGYEQTEILVKPGKESVLSLLEEDLKEEYSIGTAGATLEEDSEYDVRVIVGKE